MFTRLARLPTLGATLAIGALCTAAVALPQAANAAPNAPAVTYTQLSLLNGWHSDTIDGSARAAVANISGIVTFRGAIWAPPGSVNEPFVLPPAFRPATLTYVPVDNCSANNGRLIIHPDGTVLDTAEAGISSNATCFTSLDGVSFAKNGTGFKALTLQNGWQDYGAGTARPGVRLINGIVHFRGAISSGNNADAFTLPKGFRPAKTVYIKVDLCGAANGRLVILPDGAVIVEAEISFSDAQCFTSLDGASFAMTGTGFTALALQNGWHSYASSTAKAAVRLIGGVVYFRGAIATNGTNPVLFTLPKSMRPSHNVWIPVDLCLTNNGRLHFGTNGVVRVEEEGNTFFHAACFTSLEGAWYAR